VSCRKKRGGVVLDGCGVSDFRIVGEHFVERVGFELVPARDDEHFDFFIGVSLRRRRSGADQ